MVFGLVFVGVSLPYRIQDVINKRPQIKLWNAELYTSFPTVVNARTRSSAVLTTTREERRLQIQLAKTTLARKLKCRFACSRHPEWILRAIFIGSVFYSFLSSKLRAKLTTDDRWFALVDDVALRFQKDEIKSRNATAFIREWLVFLWYRQLVSDQTKRPQRCLWLNNNSCKLRSGQHML